MANAVASSSRDRPAQTRSSLHLRQYDPSQPVVMTHEIRQKRRSGPDGIKMINQYLFKAKVGKGQHGEVYLAVNTLNKEKEEQVVSALPSPLPIISLSDVRL